MFFDRVRNAPHYEHLREGFLKIVAPPSPYKSRSLLFEAVKFDNIQVLNWFCDNNFLGNSALIASPKYLGKAVEDQSYATIDILLENGFISYFTHMQYKFHQNLSPLTRAICLNDFHIVKQLISYPCQPPPIKTSLFEHFTLFKDAYLRSNEGLELILYKGAYWSDIQAYMSEGKSKRFVKKLPICFPTTDT